MRPHLLRFGGIGAYPGNVEINFDDLSTMGLYLITGPTGAGKTTIFDAMTFALFGKTAGSREAMLVSDFDNRVPPFVDFTFTHQGRRFEAHREPAPDRGKNPSPSKQWLREVSDSGSELRTVTGAKTVTQEVVDLLGLDAEQFMQVVLLPQGKFQEFLMANSSDRRPLLQRIFGTSLYANIAYKMKEQVDALEDAISDTKNKLENERSNARSAVDAIRTQLDVEALPSPDTDLDSLIESLGDIATDKLNAANKTAGDFEAAVAAAAKGNEDAKRFDAAEELKAVKKVHETNAKSTKTAKDSLEACERASRIKKLIEKSEALSSEHVNAAKNATTSRSAIAKLAQKLKISASQVATFQAAIDSATPSTLSSELEKVVGVVDQAISAIDELQDAEEDATRARKEIGELDQQIVKAESKLKTLTNDLGAAKKKAALASDAARKLPKLETAADKLEELRSEADVDGATKELERATKKLQTATDAYNKAESAHATALTNYTKHLSSELAAKLKPGEPCLVCGSTSHPKKAAKVQIVDLTQVAKDRDVKHRVKTECEADVKVAQKDLVAAKNAKKKLPPAAEIKRLEKELATCAPLAAEEDELNESVSDLSDQINEFKESINRAVSSKKVAQEQLKTAEKKIANLTPKVGAIGLNKDVQSANELLDQIRREVSGLEKVVKQSERAHAALDQSKKAVADALKAEGFASIQKATDALLEDDEIEELELTVEESEEREETITRLTGAISSGEVPRNRPNTEALESARVAAMEADRAAQTLATSIQQALKQLESARKKINSIGPSILAKEAQLASAASVAKTFYTGSGTGEDRILGLEEWVQRALFEEVCEVATEQLRTLSGNRYVLTLNAEGAKTRRRAGGLELYVIDGHSGKTRSVNTLSGGEQFLTSLALALALAEVVQRHAGGMELASLFIDEGFGGLDADTLDVAMDVLLKLHDTGRTVGVITHVEAMQQQLPVGVRINKTATGSTIDVLAS